MINGAERNKRVVWYALYEGTEDVIVDGKRTGQKYAKYGKPQKMRVNVSGTSGLTNNNLSGRVEYFEYGQQNMYTLTINPLPRNCKIDEMSVFWINESPVLNEDGTTDTPYDHIIFRIAPSLNWRACQVTQVKRSNGVISGGA